MDNGKAITHIYLEMQQMQNKWPLTITGRIVALKAQESLYISDSVYKVHLYHNFYLASN